jgi:hypothetical protein
MSEFDNLASELIWELGLPSGPIYVKWPDMGASRQAAEALSKYAEEPNGECLGDVLNRVLRENDGRWSRKPVEGNA